MMVGGRGARSPAVHHPWWVTGSLSGSGAPCKRTAQKDLSRGMASSEFHFMCPHWLIGGEEMGTENDTGGLNLIR